MTEQSGAFNERAWCPVIQSMVLMKIRGWRLGNSIAGTVIGCSFKGCQHRKGKGCLIGTEILTSLHGENA